MKNAIKRISEYLTPDKPYNKCIICEKLGSNCDGPNFLAMSGDRWLDWVRLRKEYIGWSNADIAEISGISKASIDRIFSGHGGDIRISTMEAITKTLVNGTWGQFPCADPGGEIIKEHLRTIEQLKEKIAALNDEIRAAHSERRETATQVSEEQQKKIEYLKKDVEDLKQHLNERKYRIQWCEDSLKWHKRVIVVLGIVCFLFVAILMIDLVAGGIGWFRY